MPPVASVWFRSSVAPLDPLLTASRDLPCRSKHLAERGRREQPALGALDLPPGSRASRYRGPGRVRARNVDGVPHQPMRFRIHARDERGRVDAGDGRKDRMVRREDDAALAEGGQPRHDLWRHVVRTEAVDDDDQVSATGALLCSARRQPQCDHDSDQSASSWHRESHGIASRTIHRAGGHHVRRGPLRQGA